jgi:trehalose/maltose hydrolase-like predicted phosphorylase
VLLGRTEYENNINNNWYTNRMAAWTLEWTLEAHNWLAENAADALSAITSKTALNADTEFAKWNDIIAKMYYPKSEKLGVVLQQDGFLDKEQLTADDLSLGRAPDQPALELGPHLAFDLHQASRRVARLLLLEPPLRGRRSKAQLRFL